MLSNPVCLAIGCLLKYKCTQGATAPLKEGTNSGENSKSTIEREKATNFSF